MAGLLPISFIKLVQVCIHKKGAFKNIDIKQCPIYEFYKNNNITFTKLDGIEIYEKYKSNKNNLILIDPLYLKACNDFYRVMTSMQILK